jgi:hypothetical protein
MAIVVLPRIEQENPFGQLAEVISEQALPYLVKLYANKDKITKLSDTELTDFVEVLRRHASELVADGKINWEKVNEWAQSDDPMKLKVASFIFDAKRMREDFSNAPLIAKLQTIDVASVVNPQELNKIFVAGKMQQRLAEAIGKSNLPDAYKLLFLANIEKFAEKPELIPILDKILSEAGTTQQQTTEQGSSGTGSWQLSLDGSKPFGIQLEEPQLVPPQVSPPQVLVAEQKSVVKRGAGQGGQKPAGGQQKDNVKPQPQAFWRDGVLWEPRVGKDGKIEYKPREAPLIEQDPFDLVVGGVVGKLLSKAGGVIGKAFGRKGVKKLTEKETQKVAENVAKETAENVATKTTTQDVMGQTSKYDVRRQELKKKIDQQMRDYKEQSPKPSAKTTKKKTTNISSKKKKKSQK